jgi:hypothetical protein
VFWVCKSMNKLQTLSTVLHSGMYFGHPNSNQTIIIATISSFMLDKGLNYLSIKIRFTELMS